MGLQIADHLQAMLDGAQPVIAFTQQARVLLIDQPGSGEGIERRPRPLCRSAGLRPPWIN
jgi:hypothetical protein